MRPRLPPLNTLKAFEAAARHESFTRAAEELFVTQGAVSQQVKALESGLGLKLFNRERQRLIITEAGRDYLTVVRDALDRIAVGTERLLQRQNAGVLTVSTSPDFAAKWLVHRLGHFAEAHPEIDLRVSATLHHVDFAREEVDLAVRHGDGNWPGLDAGAAEQRAAVCGLQPQAAVRPAQARQAGRHPEAPADPSRQPRGLEQMAARRRRRTTPTSATGRCSTASSMVIDAAINGQGVALARTTLAAWDLINGRLVRPFPEALAAVEDLLDPLSQGDVEPAEDRDLPELAAGRSSCRHAPPQGDAAVMIVGHFLQDFMHI